MGRPLLSSRRSRAGLFPISAVVLLCGAAYAEACSLFIPFDDYAGSGAALSEGGADGAVGHDGALADGGDDLDGDADAGVPLVCIGVDVKSDPANCGVCGRRCSGDAGCEAGRCPVELVLDNPGGSGMTIRSLTTAPFIGDAAAPEYVYFTRANGTLGRTEGLTGTPDTSLTDAAVGTVALAAAGTIGAFASPANVAWFRESTFDAGPNGIVSASVTPGPMALQGNVLFWGDSQGLWYKVVNAVTPRIGPVNGSAVPPVDVQVWAGILYWVTSDGAVYRMDTKTPGNGAAILSGGYQGAESFAVGKKNVIVGQASQGLQVFTFNATGQLVPTKFIPNYSNPVAMTTDPTQTIVYVVDLSLGAGKGRLLRLSADGTVPPVVLADTINGAPHTLAVADDWVYFADGTRILRTSK